VAGKIDDPFEASLEAGPKKTKHARRHWASQESSPNLPVSLTSCVSVFV
jgi:hypothetical protein